MLFRSYMINNRNLTMLVDFYELTMAKGYLDQTFENKIAYFDMFFRKIPDNGGYCIMAGVEQLIHYIQNLNFSTSDIDFLKSKNIFNSQFLDYLKNFKFTCDIYAVKEGTPIFENEPIITVKGPIIQAQLIETMILLTINHQTLIATKSHRICLAANDRDVIELGSRRAQGYDGAIYGSRAAITGGCSGTACSISEQLFNIPTVGTMAHSWVQLFDSEYDAFKAWATSYPDNCVLLVDTYNVLKCGIPNAIKVFDEILKPQNKKPKGIRLDSGDITYLSKKCRELLDNAGYKDCKIIVSNSLDEYIIRDVLEQGACIDSFGVGERLITSKSSPILGGVYKLVAVEDDNNQIIPKIKISENEEKITNPGVKKILRFFDKNSNKALADLILLNNEKLPKNDTIEIFNPLYIWKRKTLKNFYYTELLTPIFLNGNLVYNSPSVMDIQKYCQSETSKLWSEILRIENPHSYYVDLSKKLYDLKQKLLFKERE